MGFLNILALTAATLLPGGLLALALYTYERNKVNKKQGLEPTSLEAAADLFVANMNARNQRLKGIFLGVVIVVAVGLVVGVGSLIWLL